MPPRTALFEIATRSNNYVCRSCLTALGISTTPHRSLRGYARKSRTGASLERRQQQQQQQQQEEDQVKAPPEPPTTPKNEAPKKGPVIRYFEKDPRTGEITPIPEVEDDGEDEPGLDDLAKLGRRAFAKFDMLDETFAKLDQLDGPLERLLEKHGPPGALEAYRLALKSYDEPDEDNASQPKLDAEPDPNVSIEDVLGPLRETLSGSNYSNMPELKEAISVVQDALKNLTGAAKGEVNSEANSEANGKDGSSAELGPFIDDDTSELDIVNTWERGSRHIAPVSKSGKVKRATKSKLALRDGTDNSATNDKMPTIWFDTEDMSTLQSNQLYTQREALLSRLEASMAAIGKTDRVRRRLDDSTQKVFKALSAALAKPFTRANDLFWQQMWTIFSHEGPSNPFRASRVHLLAEVMLRAGATLTDEQQLTAIEATFELGHHEKALAWWKRLVETVGGLDSRTGLAYWELGVKLWCAYGDVGRAERACKALLDRSTPFNPADTRVLLHVIRAYLVRPATAEKGFLLYRRMRELATSIEKPMEIQDYDDVISLFLLTGHTDYAMFAFTDMMFAGTVNLYGNAKLPSIVRNNFFFGKWLKRLIGAGDLDGAYEVLVFMQKNGVMAAAIQLNGLIGAWLRTGSVVNRTKAYKLAMAMIRSREVFVDLRKRESLIDWPIRLQDNRPNRSYADPDKLDYGMVPRATVETFIIMAGEYRERSLFGKLEELFVAYQKCEMPGDAMMMNELLAGVVAEGRGDKARELYQSMVHEHGILPSTDTFVILFSSLPVNTSPVPIVNNPGLVALSMHEARAVFADMMRSAWVYSEKQHSHRSPVRALSEGQAKLILHTFHKTRDWAGLSAALMGLRDVLGYQLTRGVVLEMIEGIERIDRRAQRMGKIIVRATLALQHLVAEMQVRGQLPEGTTVEGMRDWKVLYTILLQWFYRKMQVLAMQDGPPEMLLEQAKEEMGVAALSVTMPSDVD